MNKAITTCAFAAVLVLSSGSYAAEQVPLKTKLPKPVLFGTPVPPNLSNLEPARKGKRPDFLIPAAATNLAAGKPVSSSDSEPVMGSLDMITDGDKDGDEGSWVELGADKQWVQIDLGQKAELAAVLVWHYHAQERAYRAVVVQVSDDPKFMTGVTTIFNADAQNAIGLGAGKDFAYIENYEGKLIDAKKATGRYVRLYSNGNTSNKLNHYIEVEVFGVPVGNQAN